jgi:SsrA-binding protein
MQGMLLVKNRSALHDHTLISEYFAGIVLKGSEVKSIREKHVSFEGSYIQILGGIPVIVNLQISAYSKQGKDVNPQDATRSRKLLLNKKEILEITRELDQKGRTAIPLALVLVNNLIKLEFAVVKGKKEYEKKAVAKDRQVLRDLEIEVKSIKKSSER